MFSARKKVFQSFCKKRLDNIHNTDKKIQKRSWFKKYSKHAFIILELSAD